MTIIDLTIVQWRNILMYLSSSVWLLLQRTIPAALHPSDQLSPGRDRHTQTHTTFIDDMISRIIYHGCCVCDCCGNVPKLY
jgi:hypothetical protein